MDAIAMGRQYTDLVSVIGPVLDDLFDFCEDGPGSTQMFVQARRTVHD